MPNENSKHKCQNKTENKFTNHHNQQTRIPNKISTQTTRKETLNKEEKNPNKIPKQHFWKYLITIPTIKYIGSTNPRKKSPNKHSTHQFQTRIPNKQYKHKCKSKQHTQIHIKTLILNKTSKHKFHTQIPYTNST